MTGPLKSELLNQLLIKYQYQDTEAWEPTWCARYTVMDTRRSVIKSLGYTVGARRV